MAVLSKREIDERRKLPVGEAESLVITPILGEEVFDEESVDLRLGTYFLMPQIPPQPFIDPNSPKAVGQSYLRLHTPLGSYFVLPAHQTVLGATLEYIKLPFDVSGLYIGAVLRWKLQMCQTLPSHSTLVPPSGSSCFFMPGSRNPRSNCQVAMLGLCIQRLLPCVIPVRRSERLAWRNIVIRSTAGSTRRTCKNR